VIEVVRAGGLATVQDLGRPGYAYLGVGRSGAADRGALRLANRLVGNADGTSAIEVTLGGFAFVAHRAVTVALTGAPCPGPLGWGAAISVPAGGTVSLGTPPHGLRSYLAMRGGIEIEPVLGSCSTDTLGGLGLAALVPGDVLAIGHASPGEVSGELAAPPPLPGRVRVVAGPRVDWFVDNAIAELIDSAWTVGAQSNRIGLRLQGPALVRRRDGELPTEPTLPGALQVPPDGRPILLGPDAPVTGGYPVIAVVADADLDACGQLRPGDQLRFRS
jgi:biotin-dependent carboxylase-like uncharacterized protein